jgi:hypothetical protein
MKIKIAALLAFLLAAFPLAAHDAVKGKGPNGGRVVDAGAHHVELVVSGTAVTVYVTDFADKPVSVGGFKGLAILTVGGKAQRIVLAPQEGTRLTGTAPMALPAQVKGVVQLTTSEGKTAQGRFQ